MSVSSVPALEFLDSGLSVPEETAVLSGVFADINAAFGGGLNPNLETPQGQLATTLAAIIADKNTEFAYFVNQVDPQYASGSFQDAIARIYFLSRKPATSTVVTATIIGVVGATIPAGALAKDTSGNLYALSADTTIPATGSIDAVFACAETGPIACPAGTLTNVYQAVTGWDAVTNPSDGVIGSVEESRADFETRRKNSVAVNSKGAVPSVYGSVAELDNVTDVYVTENTSGATVPTGETSYPLLAHSIYVAVVGGLDADIAQAIWTKKDVGCDYNGNTSVTVTDDSGYSYPVPSYEVKFERPAETPVYFAVQIADNAMLPSDITEQVQAAIVARFTGADGAARERIGSSIFASRYYGPISSISSEVAIISVQIGTVTANSLIVPLGIDQVPTIDTANISVSLV